jgi:hypothetical protein
MVADRHRGSTASLPQFSFQSPARTPSFVRGQWRCGAVWCCCRSSRVAASWHCQPAVVVSWGPLWVLAHVEGGIAVGLLAGRERRHEDVHCSDVYCQAFGC